jgi:hypothetical protein
MCRTVANSVFCFVCFGFFLGVGGVHMRLVLVWMVILEHSGSTRAGCLQAHSTFSEAIFIRNPSYQCLLASLASLRIRISFNEKKKRQGEFLALSLGRWELGGNWAVMRLNLLRSPQPRHPEYGRECMHAQRDTVLVR